MSRGGWGVHGGYDRPGALGSDEAGAAIGLMRSGARFDVICGTSIGKINAAFWRWTPLTSSLALDLAFRRDGAEATARIQPSNR